MSQPYLKTVYGTIYPLVFRTDVDLSTWSYSANSIALYPANTTHYNGEYAYFIYGTNKYGRLYVDEVSQVSLLQYEKNPITQALHTGIIPSGRIGNIKNYIQWTEYGSDSTSIREKYYTICEDLNVHSNVDVSRTGIPSYVTTGFVCIPYVFIDGNEEIIFSGITSCDYQHQFACISNIDDTDVDGIASGNYGTWVFNNYYHIITAILRETYVSTLVYPTESQIGQLKLSWSGVDINNLEYLTSLTSATHYYVCYNSNTLTSANYYLSKVMNTWWTYSPSNPYSDGGENDGLPTGGGGNFDDSSDTISIPSLPSLSACDAKFIQLYNPSTAELQSLASYMWSSSLFDVSTWQKLFSEPMQCILGLSIVPVAPSTSGSGNVQIGNITTTTTMNIIDNQYVEVNCGSITVNEYWGGYMDYSPYTKMELYLPYCGIHPLDTDDIMNNTLSIVYHIDILSGSCIAYVKSGNAILYTFSGNCAVSIPITGNDWTNVINGSIGIATSIGSMIATGGMSAPVAIPSIVANTTNSMKPSIERSGAISGSSGLMGYQKPYLIITRPNQLIASNEMKLKGFPQHAYYSLGNLSGYTVVEDINLTGVSGTQEEKEEIINLLKSGVFIQ